MEPTTANRTSTGVAGIPRSLASGLLKHGSVNEFRAAAPLPLNAQLLFDKAVIKVGMTRLVIVQELLRLGLTFDLPNWLSVPFLYWEGVNRTGQAQRTMNPKARGERHVPDRTSFQLPIFATWEDFSFGIRDIMASERVGAPLDTTMVEQATRNVNEAIEDQAINGAGFTVSGFGAPGFLTSPVNNYQYTGGTSWATQTPANILADVMAMIGILQAQFFYGPYILFVPTAYAIPLGKDYATTYSGTILQRILDLNITGAPQSSLRVVVADQLPANRTILLQPTSDVVDVVVGQQPTLLSWGDDLDFERYFMMLASMVVRIKQDYDGHQGFVVGDTVAH